MKTFIIGDIHGAYRAMLQVLDRAGFNPTEDTLIGLGDYVDGWSESFEVIEYLSNLPYFMGVIGNHDAWCMPWFARNEAQHIWTSQGGKATIASYSRATEEQKRLHFEFLRSLPPYLVLDDNYAVVMHGGCVADFYIASLSFMSPQTLMWDRDLYYDFYSSKHAGRNCSVAPFKHVFIGHTQTGTVLTGLEPFEHCGLYNLDQGAGWNGKLTVMDVYSKAWWQSDLVPTLYPEVKGRK